jgi:enterochelin esterase-like enzyme
MTRWGWTALAALAALAAAAAVHFWSGRGEQTTMRSRILEERRTLLVHLPPGYHDSTTRYPVLYVLDAVGRPSRFGPSLSETGAQIDAMAAEGVGPLIVIGVVNTHRSRDMVPSTSEPYPESGGADLFLACLTQEVIPHVDESFRTTGERLLYGRSDSALFALYALIESPDAFSGYIASSPTVGHCPGLLEEGATRLLQGRPALEKTVFIVYGEDDIPLAREFVPALAGAIRKQAGTGLRFGVKAVPRGGHIPAGSLADGLRFHYSASP